MHTSQYPGMRERTHKFAHGLVEHLSLHGAAWALALLAAFLFRDDWTAYSLEVDTSLVIHALKRSGTRMP